MAAPWDSRNVSDSAWACSDNTTSALTLDFSASGGGFVAACGMEVLQGPSQTQPTISLPAAQLTASRYTLLAIDRDAPNAAGPTRSPLRHMALLSVPRAALQAGVGSAAAAAQGSMGFSGPQPPAGSGCHRYYVQVYAEAEGVAPQAFAPSRFLWNFTQWAANSSLALVGGTHFRTQSSASRVADCDGRPLAPPPPGGAPAPLSSAALAAAIAVPLALVAACGALAWWRARRAARLEEEGAGGGGGGAGASSGAEYGQLPLDKGNPLFGAQSG
jgi:phosphatidylethanolamine-binding protein (PEBP) family uncharacterized protein